MKGIFRIKSWIGVLAIALFGSMFTHCSKDPTSEETGIRLRFIHLSPDAGSIQFKLNDQNAYTPALAYRDTTTYLSFEGGTYNVSVALGSTVPINTIIDFIPTISYSLFAVDSSGKLKMSIIKDDLSIPSIPLRAKVRFFNFSPDSGGLTLRAVSNSDTLLISTGRTFNDVNNSGALANFQLIPSNVYDLLLYSGTKLLTKLPVQPLLNYKIYTIYARGTVAGAANQAISIGVIANN